MNPQHTSDIKPDEVARIEQYWRETLAEFGKQFRVEGSRFKGAEPLLDRFDSAIKAMLEHGRRALISGVDEAHNELCVASELLASPQPAFSLVEYEPRLPRCVRSIDFRASTVDGATVFVDVKTINPDDRNRWEQYVRANEEEWLDEFTRISLLEDWGGGKLWHSMTTARSRMLEHTLDLEKKIRVCQLIELDRVFVLWFCRQGVGWDESQLEDFSSFYAEGVHREDDPFGRMETTEMAAKQYLFDKSISRFAYSERHRFAPRHHYVNWNVTAPPSPLSRISDLTSDR